MYPNQEEDKMKLAAPLSQQMEMTPAYTAPQPMPVNQEKGMGGQMMDMAKQRAMTGALDAGQAGITSALTGSSAAPVVASGVEGGAMLGPMAGSGAMTGMATAMPYVGAGILAGKALGLFSHGGQVGPLNPQYAYDGDKARASYEYQMKMGRQNKKDDEDLVDMITKGYEFSTGTAKRNAQAVGAGDPLAKRKYGAGIYGTYYDQGGKISNGPLSPEYNAEGSFTDNPVIDKLFNEIDQLYREAAQHDAVGDSAMAFDKRDKAEYLQGEFERIKRGMSRLPPENVTYPVEADDNVITRGMKGLFNIPDYYNNAKQIPTNAAALMNEDPIAMRKYGGISDVEREKSGEL